MDIIIISLLFNYYFVLFIMGDDMKKLNNNGWGISAMIGFMIAFVIFLIIIAVLTYHVGI